MGSPQPLRVWVLSDGQPGHYNLSRGIVSALAMRQSVQESWIDVRLRAGLARNAMRRLLNRRSSPPPLGWLRWFYTLSDLPKTPCDVIVSAGGRTSFANAWLAGRLQVPNIYAGSLRRLSPRLFRAVLTLEPVEPAIPNNLVLELPPSAIHAKQVDAAGRLLREQLAVDRQGLWTLMLGGDGAGYRYRDSDWRGLALLLDRLADRHGIRWLVVGSRRTGARAELLLREHLNAENVVAYYWYRPGYTGSVEAWLGAADRLFVTEDSMTMLTEAIYAGRPVISLRPQSVAATQRYSDMIDRFAHRGWIRRYAIEDLVAERDSLATGNADYRPLDRAPLDGLSQQLYERLWPQQP